MQFIDLKTQYQKVKEKVQRNIDTVLEHGQYIMGPEIAELEKRLAEYTGVKYCIGVSSGTDALLISMMALNIGSGDEVITTPFSFIATAETIALLGAKPVFVDIDEKTYNIDPKLIESAITNKTKAIMPVSLYGQCADFDVINSVAKKHGLPVIEDGCQSFGATYKGRKSCGLSTIGTTSFFPSKPLGCYGDGGAIFTNDDALATKMAQIKNHGQDKRYHHARLGINGRLDTIQAAILLAKMDIFEQEVAARAEIGRRYSELLVDVTIVPYIEEGNSSVYAQYTIQVDDRDSFTKKLNAEGIPTAVHYPIPLDKQPALKQDDINIPISDKLSDRVVSLPMHPYLKDSDQEKITESIKIALAV